MPIQARKWTDEQRDAMARGRLDQRLPAKEVARRAGAGTLADGLASFGPPPISTVRDSASKEQRRRNGQTRSKLAREKPAAALEQLWERLVSACDTQLAKLERQVAAGRAKPDELTRMARTIASLGPITRELERNVPDDAAMPASNKAHRRSKAPTLADGLLEDARREARGGQVSDGYADTHIGNADPDGPLDLDGNASPHDGAHAEHEATEHDGADWDNASDSGMDTPALEAASRLREQLGVRDEPTPDGMPLP